MNNKNKDFEIFLSYSDLENNFEYLVDRTRYWEAGVNFVTNKPG